MSLIKNIAKRILSQGQVLEKEQIAAHSYRLRLKVKGKSFRNYQAGQQLRIMVSANNPAAPMSDLVRTYSVWKYDPSTELADLAVCTFSEGPGAKWIQSLQTGENIYFGGPKGKFVWQGDAKHYFFLGDISALGPMYELRRQLAAGQACEGIIYAREEADFFDDLDGSRPFQQLIAPGNPAKQVQALLQKSSLPLNENSKVYIGGETAFCQEMTYFFRKELNWKPRQIKTKAFWHPDKKGLE